MTRDPNIGGCHKVKEGEKACPAMGKSMGSKQAWSREYKRHEQADNQENSWLLGVDLVRYNAKNCKKEESKIGEKSGNSRNGNNRTHNYKSY